MSQDQDPFFKKNMYTNFGDLGQNAKDYVEQFASKSQLGMQLDSIADMKRFVEDYPEFRKLSGNVSKHVTLISELSRRVGEDSLLDVSELEQSLACNDNHNADLKALQQLLARPNVPPENKLRLVAIYALRYSNHPSNAVPMLTDLLGVSTTLSQSRIAMIKSLQTYHKSLQQTQSTSNVDIFTAPGNLFTTARSALQTRLKGVENVYTQHTPLLSSTISDLLRGRLSTVSHPFVEGGGATKDRPQDVIVFMIGGTTYEEARMVATVNASTPGVRIVLGGTSILRSESFLEQVADAVGTWPRDLKAEERLRREVGR